MARTEWGVPRGYGADGGEVDRAGPGCCWYETFR
jgi:hypothetical protein